MTREPEEILDEPHEQIMQRVCAIDVAKDSGKVCVRLPAESGSGGAADVHPKEVIAALIRK